MKIDWTPVEESLPDTDATVLVHIRDNDWPVWLGWWSSDTKLWRTVEGAVARTVTHWAEMPDPPNGAA